SDALYYPTWPLKLNRAFLFRFAPTRRPWLNRSISMKSPVHRAETSFTTSRGGLRLAVGALLLLCLGGVASAQTARVIPRPPAQAPGPPNPADGSAAPDGYAPIPEWLGQTRAPKPAKTAAYEVETVVSGLMGGFCFSFLPDGRLIVGERPGRIRIVGKDGRLSDPIAGLPSDMWA